MSGIYSNLTRATGHQDADKVGKVKVLIVGNSGAILSTAILLCTSPVTSICFSAGTGKTALAYLLATGQPLASVRQTVGCNVFVKESPP